MSTRPDRRGKVIAFYSFKGGTGRSMALANVACVLAQSEPSGGRILVVDWDLEAPGLHRYLYRYLRRASGADEEVQAKHPGLIDLFIQIRDKIDTQSPAPYYEYKAASELLDEVPIDDYIIETDIPNLSFLKAGTFDREYAAKVSSFHWPSLYHRAPGLIRAFAERLTKDFRYVLIDSRTGLTDTSGICTMLMPEIIVAVFTPNRQSLAGVIDVIEQAGSYRSESDDLRPLLVYPLPSRIESSEPDLRNRWRFGDDKKGVEGFQPVFEAAFTRIYGLPECDLRQYFDDVQIQHVPRYAYGEEIAVLEEKNRDRLSLTRSYERFAARLVEAAEPWDETGASEAPLVDTRAIDDERQQRISTASYFAWIKDQASQFRRKELTFSLMNSFSTAGTVLLAVVVSVLLSVVDFQSNVSKIMITSGVGLIAVLQILAISLRFPQQAAMYRVAVQTLEREMLAFERRAAPYDTENALTPFIERTEPLLRERVRSKQIPGRVSVYISYRRDDSAGYTERLYDALSARFGAENVFMDYHHIPVGTDFVSAIDAAIRAANVVLVVIGPRWLMGTDGRRSSGAQSDFVSMELAAAFRRDLPVVPVLVGGASPPTAKDLPLEIQTLARRNAVELSDTRWTADTALLIRAIERIAG